MSIKEAELNTLDTMQINDFVRIVTHENSSSKALISLVAKTIVENYTGSSLGESNQSVKDAIDSLKTSVDNEGLIEVKSQGTINELPAVFFNPDITETHMLVWSDLGDPTAQVGDWTVTTSNGYVSVSGEIDGETSITLILGKKHSD